MKKLVLIVAVLFCFVYCKTSDNHQLASSADEYSKPIDNLISQANELNYLKEVESLEWVEQKVGRVFKEPTFQTLPLNIQEKYRWVLEVLPKRPINDFNRSYLTFFSISKSEDERLGSFVENLRARFGLSSKNVIYFPIGDKQTFSKYEISFRDMSETLVSRMLNILIANSEIQRIEPEQAKPRRQKFDDSYLSFNRDLGFDKLAMCHAKDVPRGIRMGIADSYAAPLYCPFNCDGLDYKGYSIHANNLQQVAAVELTLKLQSDKRIKFLLVAPNRPLGNYYFYEDFKQDKYFSWRLKEKGMDIDNVKEVLLPTGSEEEGGKIYFDFLSQVEIFYESRDRKIDFDCDKAIPGYIKVEDLGSLPQVSWSEHFQKIYYPDELPLKFN